MAPDVDWTDRADVVIVGGGGAGMAAAVSAAENDPEAEVVLLQKLDRLGGSTTISMGSITAAGTYLQAERGIQDWSEIHFHDLDEFVDSQANGTGQSSYIEYEGDLKQKDNLDLRRLLVEEAGPTVDWLHNLGCEYAGPYSEPGHSVPRIHQIVPDTESYAEVLGDRLDQLGVEVRFETKATELVTDNGSIVGVRAERREGSALAVASDRGVVLATGDYVNDPELRANFTTNGEAPAVVDFNTGDGHRMAAAVGARLVNMDIQEYFLRLGEPLYTNPELPALVRQGAILVNANGARFVRETAGYDQAFRATLKQPDREAYIVFDDPVAQVFSEWPHYMSTYGKAGAMWAYLDDYLETTYLQQKKDVSTLAAEAAMDPEVLVRSIRRYNDRVDIDGHRVDPLGRAEHRTQLDNPPYYVLGPVRPYCLVTDGGIAVDTALRALDESGTPIQGLTVAGIAAGDVLLFGHGHHHAWTFTTGRIAGSSVAGTEN